MERLYQETCVVLQQTHYALGKFERAGNEQEAQALAQSVYEQLKSLDDHTARLDIFVNKEPPNRRHTVRMKVDQLKSECQQAHTAMNNLHNKLTQRWRAAAEREELLNQRFQPTDTALSIEDHDLQMNHRLHSSNRGVDDLLNQGAAVLENLRSQHLNLRGIRRRFLDVGAQLGLSNTTLRMIDRRVSEDWVVFCVGCVCTLVFMYAFYRYWKG